MVQPFKPYKMLMLCQILIPVLFHEASSAVTYTDFGFSLSTLSLLAGPDMNEDFHLGESATFRFEFTTANPIQDKVTIDFGAYYNGYSALIFCGEPEIEYTAGDVTMSQDTIDESISPSFDTMKLDFGSVDWPAQTTFSITFSVMLINHEKYVPASVECCYWFGAGVEYNSGMANWVTDIAFSLAERSTETSEILELTERQEAQLVMGGGAGSRIVNLVMPLSTTPSLIVTARLKEDEPFYAGSEDKICLCDFSVIAATKSFYGCGDVVLPLFDKIVSPPFNESECIKEIKLDFGPMAKLGVSNVNDNMDFLLVYRSTMALTDTATTSSLFEVFAHIKDTEKAHLVVGDTNIVPATGSLADIDVVKLTFSYDGPTVGSVFAASMEMKPMATSKNAVPKVSVEFEYTGKLLSDLNYRITMTEKGSCCEPRETNFKVEEVGYRGKKATLDILPVSFAWGEETSFKVTIYGIVTEAFIAENFAIKAYIHHDVNTKPELCSSCQTSQQISSTDMPEYDPNYFPAISLGVVDEKTGKVESHVPVFEGGIGMVSMVMTMAANAPANIIHGLTVAFALDELGISVLELIRVTLTHVGDNYPSLKDHRDDEFKVDYTLATKNSSLYNTSYTSFEIYLGKYVTYLPLNTKDVKDRQVIVSLFFSLPQSVSSTWVEPIIGVVSMDEYEETAVTALVVAEIVEETEEVISSYGNLATLQGPFGGEIFRVTSWPQNDVMKGATVLDPSWVSEIAPYEEKVFLVKLYIPPAYSYNEYSLSFAWTPDTAGKIPIFGKSEDTSKPVISDVTITEGKNVAFVQDSDGNNIKYAVKGAFVNETREDYEVNVKFNVLGPSADTFATERDIDCTFTLHTDTDEEVGVVKLKVKPPTDPNAHKYNHKKDLTVLKDDYKFVISKNTADKDNFNPPPVPGGSFTRWLDIYIPPQTLAHYMIAVNLTEFSTDDQMVGLYRMDVISAGEYIGKSFNRSIVKIEDYASSNFSDVDYTTYLLYDLGFITNMYPEKDTEKEHADMKDTIKVAVTFFMGQEMLIGEEFNLTVTLYQVDENEVNQKLVKYGERFEVVQCHLEGLPIYARTERSFEDAIDAYPSAFSSDDYAIPIKIQLPPNFNGDPTLHIYSPKMGNKGAFFTMRGIELNSEAGVGPDLNASFLDNSGMEESTYISMERTRPDEETSVTFSIGRFTSLDTNQRMGSYNDLNTKEIAAERSFEVKVYVKVMDEDAMADEDQVMDMFWAIESKNVLVMNTYKFKVKFHPSRRPILEVKSDLSFKIDREFEPGDDIQFTVQVKHSCDSKATAKMVNAFVFKPVLVSAIRRNDSYFLSQMPYFNAPLANDDYGIFVIQRLRMTEFVEWHYIVTVTTDTTYVSEVKSYLLSQVVQPQYSRAGRASDTDAADEIYFLRSATAEAKFIVKNETCSKMKIHLYDEKLFHSCQITASSAFNKDVYPIRSALKADNNKGWRSNTWHGQWEGRQFLKVALLEKYKLSRIEFSEATSFSVFELEYSSDPEGIHWSTYQEQGQPRQFKFSDSFPTEGNDKLRYFDIRLPLIAKWFKIVFTEIDAEDPLGKEKIVDFRFSIYGCYIHDPEDPPNIKRACKTGKDIEDSYFRGFVTDPDHEVLYVCEKDLASTLNKCLLMKKAAADSPTKYQWSALDPRVQSVIGYLNTPTYTAVFAVAQSQKTFLGSDDGGRTWSTVQTQEVWAAQKLSKDSYKPAVVIPFNFPSTDKKEVADKFKDTWPNATFAANQDGIWITEPLGSDQYLLVYSWSKCCN